LDAIDGRVDVPRVLLRAAPIGGLLLDLVMACRGALLPPSLFEHPAAELSVDDSALLGEDRRQPDHIA